jgi:hypothetical protein
MPLCDPWGIVSALSFAASAAFPPTGPLPEVTSAELSALRALAAGVPGQPVWPGLFPRAPVKLARLLLASTGAFDPAALAAVARSGYGDDRHKQPRSERRYDVHDAFACALVHPAIDAAARAALAVAVLSAQPTRRGWRSRRKSWAIARWAVRFGSLDPARLPTLLATSLTQGPTVVQDQPLDPHPQGTRGALDCFASRWPRFRRTLAQARKADAWLDYPGIADLGRAHFLAFQSGCQAPWVASVFAVIEHVLACGDGDAKNLVVVGLFEAVQGLAYHAGPTGDRYEAMLGPSARAAWADLIEGWTGEGVRDLAAWRSKGR